jgi:hypothetical protein
MEMLGGYDIELGDFVSGNLHSHGGENLFNERQFTTMLVLIQGIQCSASVARQMTLD